MVVQVAGPASDARSGPAKTPRRVTLPPSQLWNAELLRRQEEEWSRKVELTEAETWQRAHTDNREVHTPDVAQ